MPWFVLFEIPPKTAHGVWERRGLSSLAQSKEEAIEEVKTALSEKYGAVHFVDIFQYRENQ
jgi:hypothetical protein